MLRYHDACRYQNHLPDSVQLLKPRSQPLTGVFALYPNSTHSPSLCEICNTILFEQVLTDTQLVDALFDIDGEYSALGGKHGYVFCSLVKHTLDTHYGRLNRERAVDVYGELDFYIRRSPMGLSIILY